MRAEIGRLDPFVETTGTGALGRMSDALVKNGYKVNAYGIDTDLVTLEGNLKDTMKQAASSESGFRPFNPSGLNDKFGASLATQMEILNRADHEQSNIFASTVSDSMVRPTPTFVL